MASLFIQEYKEQPTSPHPDSDTRGWQQGIVLSDAKKASLAKRFAGLLLPNFGVHPPLVDYTQRGETLLHLEQLHLESPPLESTQLHLSSTSQEILTSDAPTGKTSKAT